MNSKKRLLIACTVMILPLFSITHVIAQADIKVACVGNSITIGSGTTPFPQQLDVLLGAGWEVENFGVSGRTLLRQGDFPYWDEPTFTNALNYLPNKVIIMLGTNDSKPYNWIYSDQFYTDYISLVDTFANLDSQPDIWVCYPLKAFSGMYDISDSVIYFGIIPLIDSVVANRDVSLIDFYSLTEDKPDYYSDGIHPTSHGNNFIAKVLFEILVDSSIVTVVDTNAIIGKPAVPEGGDGETVHLLNDGDMNTEWITTGLPNSVVFDLEEAEEIDIFQLNFSSNAFKGYQYTIEGSLNSSDWTLLADQSNRNDTISWFSADTLLPTLMQYVRLTITSFSNSEDNEVRIPEFKALLTTGYEHAPLISSSVISDARAYIYFKSLFEGGAIAYYGGLASEDYIPLLGFSSNIGSTKNTFLQGAAGLSYAFFSESFYNGIQVTSETTYYSFIETTTSTELLTGSNTFYVYPNPSDGEVIFNNLPEDQNEISIKIYDGYGRLIKVLGPDRKTAGKIKWDGTDMNSNRVPSGVYHCVLEDLNSERQHQVLIYQNN